MIVDVLSTAFKRVADSKVMPKISRALSSVVNMLDNNPFNRF